MSKKKEKRKDKKIKNTEKKQLQEKAKEGNIK
jgi:hypothetical protein